MNTRFARSIPESDVCLILEGSYPFVPGGVSSWCHQLVQAQPDLRFSLVTLMPRNARLEFRYQLPPNIVGHVNVPIQELPRGTRGRARDRTFFDKVRDPLMRLQSAGGVEDIHGIMDALDDVRSFAGEDFLLNSRPAWDMLVGMYESEMSRSSFLDYFWTWRALMGGLYSVLMTPLPQARVYHAISTGYAGLVATRAVRETGRPAILTEHGIYTNERRIEITMADWLHDAPAEGLRIENAERTLKNLWIDTFVSYSRACYESSSTVIALYEGNQQFQMDDGAPAEKLRVVPNGIDIDRFAGLGREREGRRPAVGMVGRVVPIKDVKTFLRAAAILAVSVPDVEVFVLGPEDEDEEYADQCHKLAAELGIAERVQFTGRVDLAEYLPRLDVMVLTSISEAQPLVILEAGAAGIPFVATDIGACREMLLGATGESPELGPGGAITPLCNPSATAEEVARLLTDHKWHRRAGRAIRERVRTHYDKRVVDATYRQIYEESMRSADAPELRRGA